MNHHKIKRWLTYNIVALVLTLFSALPVHAEAVALSVSKDREVSIEYTLRIESEGRLKTIDSNVADTPLTFIHGKQSILPALEKALEGMKVGQLAKVTISPEEGFGRVHPSKITEVKKDRLPKAALKVGAKLQVKQADGKMTDIRVTEIREDTVILDSNHPLAGKKLYYEIRILTIRDKPARS